MLGIFFYFWGEELEEGSSSSTKIGGGKRENSQPKLNTEFLFFFFHQKQSKQLRNIFVDISFYQIQLYSFVHLYIRTEGMKNVYFCKIARGHIFCIS